MSTKLQCEAARWASRAKDAPKSMPRKPNTWFESMMPLTIKRSIAASSRMFTASWNTRYGVYRPRNAALYHPALSAWWAMNRANIPAPDPLVRRLGVELVAHLEEQPQRQEHVESRFNPLPPSETQPG